VAIFSSIVLGDSLLVEAEGFDSHGGWSLDQQFMPDRIDCGWEFEFPRRAWSSVTPHDFNCGDVFLALGCWYGKILYGACIPGF
jgi:hypothetical protein